MKDNLIISIFNSEEEASKAFTELRDTPKGEGYEAMAAALLKKNDAGELCMSDAFGVDGPHHAAIGAVVGGVVGLLAGPLGIIAGAVIGGVAGHGKDAKNDSDTAVTMEILGKKIGDGKFAVAAVVSEEEPAFEAALEKYDAKFTRYDASDVEAEFNNIKEGGEEVAADEPEETKLVGWRSATNRALELEG